jgi:hypothetical protein
VRFVHLFWGPTRWKEADLRLPVRGPPGVRNLRHLATAITQQKLAYEFPYSSFELDTDLNFVLLSEGKAILPVGPNFLLNTIRRPDPTLLSFQTDCVVYVRPTSSSGQPVRPDASKLDQFRGYIAAMKHSQFSIPAEMSEVSSCLSLRSARRNGRACVWAHSYARSFPGDPKRLCRAPAGVSGR